MVGYISSSSSDRLLGTGLCKMALTSDWPLTLGQPKPRILILKSYGNAVFSVF